MSVELSTGNTNNAPQFYTLEEYIKMDAKTIQMLYENELGIKYSPGCNLMITSFNKDTQERIIYFDGALPLHEFIYYINEFFNDYLLENNSNKIYTFAIIKETQYVNIFTINGAETENERKQLLKDMAKNSINILDRTYGLYFAEHHKKKLQYRSDTTIKTLDNSFSHYTKNVKPNLISIRDI
jgi:hypothetical protein